MPPTLDEKITKTEAALRSEEDPVKITALTTRLSILQAAKKEMDDDEYDDEDDDEDEKKSKKSSKKSEEKKADEKKSKKADEKKSAKKSEEDDEEEEEEESKKASAALSLIEASTGLKGHEAIGATAAVFSKLASLEATTQALVTKDRENEKANLIASVKRHVPKSQLDWLSGQKLSVVRGFVAKALESAPLVPTEEGELLIPKAAAEQGSFAALSKGEQEIVLQAEAALPSTFSKEQKEAFRASAIANIHAAKQKQLNGAGGTY